MRYELLRSVEDRSRWLDAYVRTGCEPFAHPAYAEIMGDHGDLASCFLYEDGDHVVILPLLIREIPGESEAFDAISPYGYGGPFSTRVGLQPDFGIALRDCLRDAKIVSFFGRLSLDVDPGMGFAAPGLRVKALSENVVVDLARTPDEQWRHYEHKVRKNVNKARRAGLTVAIQDDFTCVEEFATLYGATMERRGASSWYRFDADLFRRLMCDVPLSMAAEVRGQDGNLISAEIVLRSDRYYYSALGGTDARYFSLAPNDLLKDAVIRHGGQAGVSGYVLGGGYSAGDGIFRYKRSFDTEGVKTFYGLQAVTDQSAYDALCLEFGDQDDDGEGKNDDFFPRYRRPRTAR